MIVRGVEDLEASGSYQEQPGVWSRARYLLRRDGVGTTQALDAHGSCPLLGDDGPPS